MLLAQELNKSDNAEGEALQRHHAIKTPTHVPVLNLTKITTSDIFALQEDNSNEESDSDDLRSIDVFSQQDSVV